MNNVPNTRSPPRTKRRTPCQLETELPPLADTPAPPSSPSPLAIPPIRTPTPTAGSNPQDDLLYRRLQLLPVPPPELDLDVLQVARLPVQPDEA